MKTHYSSSSYFMTVIYTVFLLLSFLFINKSYSLFSCPPFSISIFIIPFWFILNSILAESYDEKFAQKIFIYAMIGCAIFILIAISLTGFISPYQIQEKNYHAIFNRQPIYYGAFIIAILSGNYSNLLVSRYIKFITNLRYMWMRSMLSSAAGQLVFIILMGIITSYQEPISVIFSGTAIMFVIAMLLIGLLTYPASIIIGLLRND